MKMTSGGYNVIIAVLMLFIIISILGGLYFGFYIHLNASPYNTPQDFLKKAGSTDINERVVFYIGDSITHGTVSADYVSQPRKEMGAGWHIINAGINGELTHNVLQRMDEIIDCRPDFVTVLIGTNDANGSSSPLMAERAQKKQNLPEKPTAEIFDANLRQIIHRLSTETDAEIAILSPPPLWEDKDSVIYRRSRFFAETSKKAAVNLKKFFIEGTI